eukprot:gene9235-10197_t
MSEQLWRRHLTFHSKQTWEKAFFSWCFESRGEGGLLGLGLRLHPSLSLRHRAGLGHDLFAVETIPTGSLLLEVPPTLWKPFSAQQAVLDIEGSAPPRQWQWQQLSAAAARLLPSQSPGARQALLQSSCLALNLLRHLANHHPYADYLWQTSYLPSALPHPLWMEEEEEGRLLRPFLLHTKTYEDILKRRKLYSYLGEELASDRFSWAMGCILSRGLSGHNYPFSLVPFLDLTNHADEERVNACHLFDERSATFRLQGLREILPDESVFISYGAARDSSSFMTLYGFLGGNDRVRGYHADQPLFTTSSSSSSSPNRDNHLSYSFNKQDRFMLPLGSPLVPNSSSGSGSVSKEMKEAILHFLSLRFSQSLSLSSGGLQIALSAENGLVCFGLEALLLDQFTASDCHRLSQKLIRMPAGVVRQQQAAGTSSSHSDSDSDRDSMTLSCLQAMLEAFLLLHGRGAFIERCGGGGGGGGFYERQELQCYLDYLNCYIKAVTLPLQRALGYDNSQSSSGDDILSFLQSLDARDGSEGGGGGGGGGYESYWIRDCCHLQGNQLRCFLIIREITKQAITILSEE